MHMDTRARHRTASRRRGRLTTRRGALAVLSAVALVAVACSDPPTSGSGEGAANRGGGDGSELPECPLDALDEATEPVPVNLWYGGLGGTVEETLRRMVDGFNQSQDQVVLTADSQGSSYQEVFRQYESTASASTSQLPQLVYLENIQLQTLADSGNILPAEACMEADGYEVTEIEPAIRSAFSVDDVLYPGYANVSTQILYYNKTHFAAAGLDPDEPPETLDELEDAARAIKDAGVAERPLALKLGHSFVANWLGGLGVDVVDNDNGQDGAATEATFDTPETRELLEWTVGMDDDGLLNPFANTEGGIDHYLALASQQSSMLIETSGAATNIRDALGGDITAEDIGVDIDQSFIDRSALVPAAGSYPGVDAPGRAFVGGAGFFILNSSDPEQQAGAWRFLRYMLEPENAKEWLFDGSFLPIVKSVDDEEDVEAFWEQDLAGSILRVGSEQVQDADPDEPGPLIGPYTDFVDELQGAVEAVVLDGADIDSTLSAAQAEVTESLQRYAGD
jgi:sn-glycerol 3-phosphate transport system substrate-binding protein